MKTATHTNYLWAVVILVSFCSWGYGKNSRPAHMRNLTSSSVDSLDSSVPQPVQLDPDDSNNRLLTSGDAEEDLSHFHSISRRMGVDIGMLVPFGDFAKDFGMAPLIGLHLSWEASPPFSFILGFMRSASAQKDVASTAKLAINVINIGAMATFPMKRTLPFVKVEGAFYFNDVSFNDGTRWVTSGDDLILSTVGINAGIGIDFVVGREVSLGLEMTYHYAIPKKLNLSNSTTFDLGSPFATAGIRVNF